MELVRRFFGRHRFQYNSIAVRDTLIVFRSCSHARVKTYKDVHPF